MKIDPVIEMSVPEPVTSVSEPATIHLVDEINEKKSSGRSRESNYSVG